MDRRGVLTAVAALGAAGIAGCSGDNPAGVGTSSSPTPTETPAPKPSIVDRTFEQTGGGCGRDQYAAEVTFGEDSVEITGTIAGSDTCQRARLRAATYDHEADELTVAVETYTHSESGETPICGECIVELDYHASVSFDGGLPSTVRVVHHGVGGKTHVTSASP